jgi:hypothetical protein
VYPQGQKKKKTDEGKKAKMKLMSNVYTVQVFVSEDHDSIERVRCQTCLKCAHTFCADCIKRVCVVTGARNDRHLFIVAALCEENFILKH